MTTATLIAMVVPLLAQAAEYHGRATFGGFVSKETFEQGLDGSTSNDFTTFSTRLRLDAFKIGPAGLQTVADIRDTHDFFDKLDRERLELTSANRLQVRQLAVKLPAPAQGRFYASAGRFPVPEAGNVFTDGAELGWRWTPELSSAVFGGLNPKQYYQAQAQWDPNSRVLGAYLLYQPILRSWDTSVYMAHAVVTERYGTETDRSFFYQQVVYQPSAGNRLLTNVYFDFVPRAYLQNGFITYTRDMNPVLSLTGTASAVDVIEYSRRQGVRERLDPSPYRDGSIQAVLKAGKQTSYTLTTTHGKRLSDGLWRHEYLARASLSKERFSTYLGAGYRRNFTAGELLARFGGGYYSDKWELTLDNTLSREANDNGTTLFPIISELGIAHFLSKSLFGTLAFSGSLDSEVRVFSGFFKLSYRFGTREIPPVRDGAPPRGEL